MLRDRAVEAMAKAIDDEIGGELREHLGHIMRKWPDTISDLASAALDALLDHLDQNADVIEEEVGVWVPEVTAVLRGEGEL
jgi:hypothetical protein